MNQFRHKLGTSQLIKIPDYPKRWQIWGDFLEKADVLGLREWFLQHFLVRISVPLKWTKNSFISFNSLKKKITSQLDIGLFDTEARRGFLSALNEDFRSNVRSDVSLRWKGVRKQYHYLDKLLYHSSLHALLPSPLTQLKRLSNKKLQNGRNCMECVQQENVFLTF